MLTTVMAFGQQKLIDFKMEDQFGIERQQSDFSSRLVIVVGSDRKGSQYNEAWITALIDSLKLTGRDKEIPFIGVADLRGVPFFLRPFVRGFLPDDKEQWVLMDWDGRFAESYAFSKDQSNLLVFNALGEKIYQTAVTDLNDDELQALLAVIRKQKQPGEQ